MKKRLLLGLSMILLFTAGCSFPIQSATTAETVEAESSDQKTLSILVLAGDATITQEIADYIDHQLGTNTVLEIRTSGMDDENYIRSRLATGTMPDIFMYNTGSLLQAIYPEHNAVDLTDEPFVPDLIPEFREAASVDGRLYAVTMEPISSYIWIYNKKIYQELGLEIPTTWAQFMENCAVIEQAGIIPMIGSHANSWYAQLVFIADHFNVVSSEPDFVMAFNENRAKYETTPAALRSFEKLSDFGNLINDDHLTTTNDEAIQMLLDGVGAHFPASNYTLNSMALSHSERMDEFGGFIQPGDDPAAQGATIRMPTSWCIYKNSPHVDLAKQWLEVYLSQECFDIYCSLSPAGGPSVVSNIELPDQVPIGTELLLQYMDADSATVAFEFQSPLKAPNCAAICMDVVVGNLDPQAAAVAYDKDSEKLALQLQIPGW